MYESNHLVETNDGSSTLKNDETGDLYHSIHGAETESQYVFIEKGLRFCRESSDSISILEVGLGTGLNALLTLVEAEKLHFSQLKYTSLEPFPIANYLVKQLKYKSLSSENGERVFSQIHNDQWDKPISINEGLEFLKLQVKLQDFQTNERYDLIYYDVFGPTYQAEMWEKSLLSKVVALMNDKCVLVTYCAKGDFRRNLESLGLEVERLPGPPGKREMIRAIKC